MFESKRKLVTASHVAEHFGVSVETVNLWVRQRRIPFIRPTRRIVRFRIADIERELEERSSGDAEGR